MQHSVRLTFMNSQTPIRESLRIGFPLPLTLFVDCLTIKFNPEGNELDRDDATGAGAGADTVNGTDSDTDSICALPVTTNWVLEGEGEALVGEITVKGIGGGISYFGSGGAIGWIFFPRFAALRASHRFLALRILIGSLRVSALCDDCRDWGAGVLSLDTAFILNNLFVVSLEDDFLILWINYSWDCSYPIVSISYWHSMILELWVLKNSACQLAILTWMIYCGSQATRLIDDIYIYFLRFSFSIQHYWTLFFLTKKNSR